MYLGGSQLCSGCRLPSNKLGPRLDLDADQTITSNVVLPPALDEGSSANRRPCLYGMPTRCTSWDLTSRSRSGL
jgi:hypothetical protein